MANMSPEKNIMPVAPAQARNKNFDEVALGYTEQLARDEAARCLNCPTKPCMSGCPVNIDIPAFIGKISEGDFEGAYRIIAQVNSLPAICGRVCPQESQCESRCVRGIKHEPVGIGRLERFCADYHLLHCKKPPQKPTQNGHKVAVVGSGPSGLACAGELLRKGYGVTVFEALHTPGGVLVYGIPEFRLPKSIVKKEIDNLTAMGAEISTNTVIGKTVSVDELLDERGYEAVFIGSGAGLPRFMNIEGENLKGVYSANEFLTRINLMKAYTHDAQTPVYKAKKVCVVGGGNVAMDAARCAKRMGAQVTVVYRRTQSELPARVEEVEHAMEEGIDFHFLTNPVKIIGDENGWVKSIKCQQMKLSEPDESGRARPVPVDNLFIDIECDSVIMSIGTSPNPLIKDTTRGLQTQKWGGIITDECGLTSRKGVYAGGDAVTGAATVILAMGAGKTAAQAIDEYISGK